MLTERTAKRTAELIAEAAKSNAPAGSEARKIGDTYSTFLDEAAIEAKGLSPLKPALEEIAAIADARALARVPRRRRSAPTSTSSTTRTSTPTNVFGLWVAQDLDDPTRYAPFLLQGGLGLPDRDYYLDPSPRMAEIRARYRAHIAAVLRLAGSAADAEAKAGRIVELERLIATSHSSRDDSSDVAKGNNHWTRADFATRAPGLDWDAFFDAAGLGRQPEFVVWQPGAVTGIAALVRDQPLATWKDYLAFHAVEQRLDVPPEGLRRRAVRLLREGPLGHAEAARPLEARRRRSPTRRSARPSGSSTSRSTSRRRRRRAPRRW